jgi:very-short-patch-repair endonuclease
MFYGASPEVFKKAAMLRRNMTDSEKVLWEQLRHGINGYKFRRQHPADIFILDFYCHTAKLVIEIDGKSHDAITSQEYDKIRTERLESFGLKVIRFTNQQVLENADNVNDEIKLYL